MVRLSPEVCNPAQPGPAAEGVVLGVIRGQVAAKGRLCVQTDCSENKSHVSISSIITTFLNLPSSSSCGFRHLAVLGVEVPRAGYSADVGRYRHSSLSLER
ncbi:hypothetical protein BAUCODRAFT_121270 [Baudoinia panamericana UAMH 10762]|uniref:Uncharacterized protein n=1 Tax=Baudoinia panamericana (strain UAMH 10762) TaxID=717646 RepID=M2LUV9_BAUPA|nr:uncharacterized protein BAUCODRAFT_121270 [Baudoinia panamericana UAMH 10762]EMC98397.1 hypothetical protein BAUCODRAFT_121270 [Baudoinia panamericana UAMH 10762]